MSFSTQAALANAVKKKPTDNAGFGSLPAAETPPIVTAPLPSTAVPPVIAPPVATAPGASNAGFGSLSDALAKAVAQPVAAPPAELPASTAPIDTKAGFDPLGVMTGKAPPFPDPSQVPKTLEPPVVPPVVPPAALPLAATGGGGISLRPPPTQGLNFLASLARPGIGAIGRYRPTQ